MNNGLKQKQTLMVSDGFSLLEMVFVLIMITVMVAWGVMSVSTVDTEEQLRSASGQIESLAKRGRNIAVKEQRPYLLLIGPQSVSIEPAMGSVATAAININQNDIAYSNQQDTVGRDLGSQSSASVKMDHDVTYSIKRWRSDDWEVIEGEKRVVIRLDPNGLVEPVSIRCSIGDSWLMQQLHPLTAGVRDEEMSIGLE